MTTTVTTNQTGPLAANGVTPLPFTFQAVNAASIEVLRAGVVVSPSTYSVTLNPDGTGVVTPLASWATDQVYIRSAPDYQQPADFPRFTPLYPDAVSKELDRVFRTILGLKGYAERLLTSVSGLPSTVVIGTITTVAVGGAATANLVLTSALTNTYRLDLGLPTGATGAGASVAWSQITGTLANQADLNAALAGKQPLDATLTALAAISGASLGVIEITGVDTFTIRKIGVLTSFDLLRRTDGDARYLQFGGDLVEMVSIPAYALVPNTTNGSTLGTAAEATTNKTMTLGMDFPDGVNKSAQFAIRMPIRWNEGTLLADFQWAGSATGSVVWNIAGVALSDGDVIDSAAGAAGTVTDARIAAGALMISGTAGPFTISGSPQNADVVVFKVSRDAVNAADTMTGVATLLGVTLYVTTNARADG